MRELIPRESVLGKMHPDCGTTRSSERSQICAAIVTYNIGEEIHRCFDSIKSQVDHVVIVDNASGEATRRELEMIAASDAVTLILNERNEGVAHAYNQAVRWALDKGFQWILTLDHDSEATPGMVDKLVKAYSTLKGQGIDDVGVVGANPFDVNIQKFLLYGPDEGGGTPLEDQMEVISSGSLISLQVFDTANLFNEDLFIYFVDTEFCTRLRRHGFKIFLCQDAVLLHKEGAKRCHRLLWWQFNYHHYGKTARYYLTRNLIYLMRRRLLSPGYPRGLLRSSLQDHLKILVFDEERFGVLWFSLRGLLDGLGGKVGAMSSISPADSKD